MNTREQMNIVVVGHVDHGKSTVIGRLLADTDSLPQGKLQQVKDHCAQTARPFEYAFLLDALKDEQAQGITIDTARCFFKSVLRDYIIIDAPGHVEFLKNMVSGAARAEAALLVIDAAEGIKENSRRHGYLVSMLGIKQVVVLVNKMDLVGYSAKVFESIKSEYSAFLEQLGVHPVGFVPLSARNGENLAIRSSSTEWYSGKTVLEFIDSLEKQPDPVNAPMRFPVQDVYKFTESDDDRRIWAGTVETGAVRVGERVVFLPSGQESVIKSIEGFSTPKRTTVACGAATGFTLQHELFVKRGEIMCLSSQKDNLPMVGSRLRVNIFWMGKAPMIKGKKYKLKLATAQAFVRLAHIETVIDASDLDSAHTPVQIERHDVADCIIESTRPLAFDSAAQCTATGRFVIVDNYEIAGGGIITAAAPQSETVLDAQLRKREMEWESGFVSTQIRALRYGHRARFVVLVGAARTIAIAKQLEQQLFKAGFQAWYLGVKNIDLGLDAQVADIDELRDERIRRLGEIARIVTSSGQIVISAFPDADANDLALLSKLNAPAEILPIAIGGQSGPNTHSTLFLDPEKSDDELLESILLHLRSEQIIDDFSI